MGWHATAGTTPGRRRMDTRLHGRLARRLQVVQTVPSAVGRESRRDSVEVRRTKPGRWFGALTNAAQQPDACEPTTATAWTAGTAASRSAIDAIWAWVSIRRSYLIRSWGATART